MFMTKVLIQILKLNLNYLTPIIAFLLVKKMKNILNKILKESYINKPSYKVPGSTNITLNVYKKNQELKI